MPHFPNQAIERYPPARCHKRMIIKRTQYHSTLQQHLLSNRATDIRNHIFHTLAPSHWNFQGFTMQMRLLNTHICCVCDCLLHQSKSGTAHLLQLPDPALFLPPPLLPLLFLCIQQSFGILIRQVELSWLAHILPRGGLSVLVGG